MIVFQAVVDVASKLTIADIPLLIAHLIASLLMIFCLSFFVYQPFKSWVQRREQKLKNNLVDTKKNLATAKEKESLAQKELVNAKVLAKQILDEARERVVREKTEIIKQTKKLREQMLAESHLEKLQIKRQFKKEIEKSIALNAIALSKKILLADLTPQKHQKLIEHFLTSLDE